MKPSPWIRRFIPAKPLVLGLLAAALSARAEIRDPCDAGWRFHLGDTPDGGQAATDDEAWRAVELPHDWSIEGKVDPAAPSEGGGGFFPTGIAWYRHHFTPPASWQGRRIAIEFEGVSANAEVFVNGRSVVRHPYAYTPFGADLTADLKFGQDNVIAVRVDTSPQPNSRWYAGSGIYRHVWLTISNPVHFDAGTTFVSTISAAMPSAVVRVEATVRNDSAAAANPSVEIRLLDDQGEAAATATVPTAVPAGSSQSIAAQLTVPSPHLWSPATPALYRAELRLTSGKGWSDTHVTTFGIRTVRVSAEQGFQLNGQTLPLIGGSVHHDNGPLGAAAFDRAETRRVELLKLAGFNAVRTSHNPPSPAFLAACDRLGILVMDEAFDMWGQSKLKQDYGPIFKEWSLRDIDAMVLRDRNHPAVVLWSIGNEVYERGTPAGEKIAHDLVSEIHRWDTTRPVTAGINGMGKGGDWVQTDHVYNQLDVAGYNYEMAQAQVDHIRYPHRVIVATESYQSEAFQNWAIIQGSPYVIGDFVWSALDYLGEGGIGRFYPPGEKVENHWEAVQYPWHGAECGDIDITGWRKPASHYRAIVWNRGEKLYAAVRTPSPDGKPWGLTKWSTIPELPSWTWPGQEGKPLTVDVYSRHQAVRVYLNGRLIQQKNTGVAQEFKATFEVPFAPGKLEAIGVDEVSNEGFVPDKPASPIAARPGFTWFESDRFPLLTAQAPAAIRLTPDRTTLRGDGQDLAFLTLEITDPAGTLNPTVNPAVQIALTGPGTLAGFANADMTSMEPYYANPRHPYQGRALVVIRTQHAAGPIEVTASAPGLASASVTLQTTPQP